MKGDNVISRKKPQKSNIVIGIFTGKEAAYHLAILKTLYKLNNATAWQIAKTITEAKKPILNKDIRETKSRKIYSVIQRKNGRLNELAGKGYIEANEGLYELTIKGYVALAIKDPAIVDAENKDQSVEKFREIIKDMPEDVANLPLGINVNRSEYKKGIGLFLDNVKSKPEVFKAIVEETKEVLAQGVDLDRIDIFTLVSLLMNRKQTRDIIMSLAGM